MVIGNGGVTVKAPKIAVSIRKLFVDQSTLGLLGKLRDQHLEPATRCELELNDDAFLFSFEAGCATSPYPDVFSKNFAKFRIDHAIPKDIYLRSFRHFAATFLDALVSERQKQVETVSI
ncbi:hypothetical protein [Ferrimicrobium acidiphilum]|uniref:Uncharacterized protein n=1 Tax=Ferrimicrobium acidiphilum DSM 19497 TaxID=1121877 RepID=A0A0D8FR87_9ACTN|nr:hypothetical protein [Ferrimicrobium acidiphilum]KJE75666.1 hypothetical protein FEAC_26260 [Ferrimicrobium acidiphilum DSM 19497]